MAWSFIIPAVIGGAATIFGADKQSDAISDASDATLQATREQINYAREARDLALRLSDPYRQAGGAAMAAMMDMMGLPRGYDSSAPPGYGPPPGPGEEGWSRYSPDNPYAEAAMRAVEEWGDSGSDMSGGQKFTALWQAGTWEQQQGNVGNFQEGWLPPDVARYGNVAGLPPGVSDVDLASYAPYDWQADPSYDWRYNEGIRAMDASSSAKGLGLSGGYGKALMRYGQDMASQEYMNIYNRLANLAGFGQVGTAAGVNATNQYGQIASNAMGGYGATRASAYVAQGNTMAGMYGDFASILGNLPWDSWFPGGSDTGSKTTPEWGSFRIN